MANRTKRQQAIIRRRVFIISTVAVLVLAIAAVSLLVTLITKGTKEKDDDKNKASGSSIASSEVISSSSKKESSSSKKEVVVGGVTLDADFTQLLLVNGDNPLPSDYDANVRKDLVEIDPQYRNNNYVKEIHKDVYPYITAMVAAAQADGVDLRVWSPFRSYAIQNDLFQKQVNRVGGDEEKAATVVARPGTSEHNTGLCADFNMASDAFENTKMYKWMTEHAEDYGFVMRYRKDKQPITGVIHESWHWRFVGINAAKEMNDLDMCLEEYVEYLKK